MNSELYDKTYRIPPEVLKGIQTILISNPNGEGVKRAKFMLKNGVLTYQSLKRLKNFFDYFNPETQDKIQYALAGGDLMKSFVDRTLNADRDAVKRSKEIKQDMTSNPNSELKPYQTPRLNETGIEHMIRTIDSEILLNIINEDKKNKKFNIENYDDLKKNTLAVIVNSDNKILLLKRSDYPKQWMPSKWSLIGGAIKKNEEPEKACEREIKEETGLDIDKFIEKVVIQRNPDSVEHIFACRYTGEPTDVTLNKENTNYGWYDVNEMEFLDTVPNLIDYIDLVFKKYE
jgi:ADP-ribose pyrophosphatase YjhB (NUDIX family)